jgi:hypothetical protein
MPDELAVYGPIITLNGKTRVISYTVEVGTDAALEYTAKETAGFSGVTINAKEQSVAALILQYGTKGVNLFSVSDNLFSEEEGITSVGAGTSYALKNSNFAIIPLQTKLIREQLSVALISSGVGTAAPIMWIENNAGDTSLNTWGGGTYAQSGIRIGGLDSTGYSSSNVNNFYNGAAAENHPRSLATVLYTGKTSTINFYNTGAIISDGIVNDAGSLLANGQTVSSWLNNNTTPPLPTPPAVRVIYEWK